MLSTIQIAVFFVHQHLRKESINTLDFVHGDNHQGKLASETATFGWYGFLHHSSNISGKNEFIS